MRPKCFVQDCENLSVPWSAFCKCHRIESDFTEEELEDQNESK